MSDFQNIATAPGDLPAQEVVRRLKTIRGQFRHENTIEPAIPRPGEPVMIHALSGTGAGIERAAVSYTTDGSVPGPDALQIEMERTGTDWIVFGGYVARWRAAVPPQDKGTVVRYRMRGWDAQGRVVQAQDGQGFWYRYDPEQGVTTFSYRVINAPRVPDWFSAAVVYQIFVDRFRSRSGFRNTDDLQAKHGGELAGIEDALPYLDELGVTCIWLTPVNPAPSYHRYDATDYFAVDPVLGDIDAMRSLTSAAHKRGMRVVLDFVPSHLSRSHQAFEDAQNDRNATSADWFYFYEWPDRYRSFLEVVRTLVSVNTESKGLREYMIRSARFWMECGIDGFRLDHVIGHGMDFWVEFQLALETVNTDVITFGEATDTGDALRRYQGRLNGILDFPLARALRLTFATQEWPLSELDSFLSLYDHYMADGPMRVSFLDNHDMDRFLYLAGQDVDLLRLAALCLFSLPQVPILYYGTEIGMTQEVTTRDRPAGGDALARQDMIWDESAWDGELKDFFAGLIAVRRNHLRDVSRRRRLLVDDPQGLYGYSLGESDRQTAVVFNLSRSDRLFPLEGAEEVLLTTGAPVTTGEAGLTLPPRTGAVVRFLTADSPAATVVAEGDQ